MHVAPAIEDPTGGTAELEAELLHTPGPTGLPAHAAEGMPSSDCMHAGHAVVSSVAHDGPDRMMLAFESLTLLPFRTLCHCSVHFS